MRKSKRAVRHIVVVGMLKHLKSDYNLELTQDTVRGLLFSNAGIDAILSFRSDSHLNDLRAALTRLGPENSGYALPVNSPSRWRN